MFDVKMKRKDTWTWKRAAKYILLKENVTYYLFSSQEVLKQFSFYMKCVNVENKVHMYWHTSQFLYIPPCIYIYWNGTSVWRHILFTLIVWCHDICDSLNFHSLDLWHLFLNNHFHKWYCHLQPQIGHRGKAAYCTCSSWNISGDKRFLVFS